MRRLLYYLSSGHRTESHIPHLSLSHSLPLSASLCFVSVSHKRLLLFSAIPSRLFSLVFHPSGVRVCCYFHLSVTAARRASHRFPSSVHSSSAPFWTPFPPLLPFSPFLSGCVFLYLTLFFFCGFMPFTWEPFLSFFQSSELHCAYLAV